MKELKIERKENHYVCRYKSKRKENLNIFDIEKIKKDKLNYIIDFNIQELKKKISIEYDVLDCVPLKYFEENKISKKEFINIVDEIVKIYKELEKNHLDDKNILLDTRYIFYDIKTSTLKVIYIPILEFQREGNSKDFLVYLLDHLNFSENDLEYVNELKEILISNYFFSLFELEEYIEKYRKVNAEKVLKKTSIFIEKKTEKLKEEKVSGIKLKRIKNDEVIRITKSPYKIGRDNALCDFEVKNNPSISRCHAMIVSNNNLTYIVDTNSANKTYVENLELIPNEKKIIGNGMRIKLANEEFIVEIN